MQKITCCTHILIVFTSCLIVIISPVVLILFAPIYIYRYIVSVMKRIFRRDLGNLINARSALFAVDDLWRKPRATLVVYTVLGGQLSVEELRANFRKRILEARRGSAKLHPELEQFPSNWMGFLFWKPEKDFRLDEHIKEYDGPIKFKTLNQDIGLKIGMELVKRPFLPGKSPWEMYVLPNYVIEGDLTPHIPKTLFLTRIHHSLADGFSLVRLITRLGGEEKVETATPNYVQRHWVSLVLHMLSFIFRIPYELASMILLKSDPIGPWHLPQRKLSRNTPHTVTPQLPLIYIKAIRDAHKASTTGIIITAITGALRKIMLESGKGIPQNFTLLTALPVPGHPKKLRNHMTAGMLSLPVKVEDPLDRLQIVERDITALRKSTFPISFFWLTKILGSLFPGMTLLLAKQYGPSAILSNFPGPSNEVIFCDLSVVDTILLGGFLPGNIGIGLGSMSYAGKLRIGIGMDESIFSTEQAQVKDFVTYVINEFDNLMLYSLNLILMFPNGPSHSMQTLNSFHRAKAERIRTLKPLYSTRFLTSNPIHNAAHGHESRRSQFLVGCQNLAIVRKDGYRDSLIEMRW